MNQVEPMSPRETPQAIAEVLAALEESVKLLGHYAGLLNQYDGGERRSFASAAEWMGRLEECRALGTVKPLPPIGAEFGTVENARRIYYELGDLYMRIGMLAALGAPRYILDIVAMKPGLITTARFNERELRFLRFALERACESIRPVSSDDEPPR